MQMHHWIMMLLILVAGYYVGANYKMNLPLVG